MSASTFHYPNDCRGDPAESRSVGSRTLHARQCSGQAHTRERGTHSERQWHRLWENLHLLQGPLSGARRAGSHHSFIKRPEHSLAAQASALLPPARSLSILPPSVVPAQHLSLPGALVYPHYFLFVSSDRHTHSVRAGIVPRLFTALPLASRTEPRT